MMEVLPSTHGETNLRQAYVRPRLVTALKKFYSRHHELVKPYNRTVCQIIQDILATMSLDGKITKSLLKTRSGEFDLESIHSLNLRQRGLSDLGCISECTALERLNLSRNDLTKLTKLAGLNNLTHLNLSANRIISLEGLQSLDSLQTLNVAGNLIGGVDSFRCLTGLENLESLIIHDRSQSLSNPLCVNKDYKQSIIKMFPKLKILDGERVHGKGTEVFEMCRQIEEALNVRESCHSNKEISLPSQWVSPDFWKFSDDNFQQSNLADAEDQLQALLASCKALSDDGEIALATAKSKS